MSSVISAVFGTHGKGIGVIFYRILPQAKRLTRQYITQLYHHDSLQVTPLSNKCLDETDALNRVNGR
jgi:trans-2-enoyl-CoA reductase